MGQQLLEQHETVSIKGGTNNIITYKIINGTAYHTETPMEVVKILEASRLEFRRIRIFYGNVKTGRDWCEEHDIVGMIGKSTGKIKVPLLLNRINSTGGGAILDDCIIKITENKRVIYKHPNYSVGELTIRDASKVYKQNGYFFSVYRNSELQANFKTEQKAQNYIAFLKGERNRC